MQVGFHLQYSLGTHGNSCHVKLRLVLMCSFRHPVCLVKVSPHFLVWKSSLSTVTVGWSIWRPTSPKSLPRQTWVVVPEQCSPMNKRSVGEERMVVCVSREGLLWAWILQNRLLFFLLFCPHHAEDLLRPSLIFKFFCNAPPPSPPFLKFSFWSSDYCFLLLSTPANFCNFLKCLAVECLPL